MKFPLMLGTRVVIQRTILRRKKIKSIFFGEKGYGCISLSDDCNNAIEFLNFCSKDNKFKVVFSENINHLAASKTMPKEC